MTPRAATFTVAPGATAVDMMVAASRKFVLRSEEPKSLTRRYYDSFDGRLHARGITLYSERVGRSTHLYCALRNGKLNRIPLGAEPVGSDDLPDTPAFLKAISRLGCRVLMPVVDVTAQRRILHALNQEEAPVCRVDVWDHLEVLADAHIATVDAVVCIRPEKGHTSAAHAFLQQVASVLGPARTSILEAALDALGFDSAGYRVPSAPMLDDSWTTGMACRTLLRWLHAWLCAHEPGLRNGTDIEFLHQYRVGVRRTRSILSQLKGAFPTDARDRLAAGFRWLGAITGPTRDLDVYLHKFEAYRSLLPDRFHDDLEPLRLYLAQQQRKEHTRVVDALDSVKYAQLMGDWQMLYRDESEWPEGMRPIKSAVSARIWRTYRQVTKRGRTIVKDPQLPAVILHDVRIRCKKLRYMIELFHTLYPSKALRKPIKVLKQLQDTLGEFNDFEVHQTSLRNHAAHMMEDGFENVDTLLTIGRLSAAMEEHQFRARSAVSKRLVRFSQPKSRRRFDTLFQCGHAD